MTSLGPIQPSALRSLISRALILWEERVGRGYVSADDVRKLRGDFAEHVHLRFAHETHQLSRTSIDLAFDWYLRVHPKLVQWYQTLIDTGDRPAADHPAQPKQGVVDWSERQPTINFSAINVWERLCGHFDPDSLLTLDLACKRKDIGNLDLAKEFSDWTTVVRVRNDYLDGPNDDGSRLNEPLSDLHIHVGGIRLPQAAWREMLLEKIPLKVFRDLNRVYRIRGRNLSDDVREARNSYRKLVDLAEAQQPVGVAKARGAIPAVAHDKWWSWSSNNLMQERQLLAWAWSRLLDKDNDDVAEQLDRYLSQKHRFFAIVRQPAFPAEPGLRHFELNYFMALKRAVPRDKWRNPGPAYDSSPRLTMHPYGDACQFLMESKALRRIELRISPLERANEYIRFFKSWSSLEKQIKNPPEVRFAVHFRRSLKRNRRSLSDADRVSDEAIMLKMLDRSTAALRIALNSDSHRGWMSALARIDIAGQERDTPASVFALHLRLLRGDRQAMEFLERLRPDDPRAPWLARWVRLKERNQHWPSGKPGSDDDKSRLGMTVHAGEDFDNLLDGLYQVAMAIDAFDLTEGDSIGHGMALATEIGDRWISHEFAIMPAGQILDSLCWLKHCSPKETYLQELAKLDELIIEFGDLLYPDILQGETAEVSDHVWVWRNSIFLGANAGGNDKRHALLAHRWSKVGMLARERIEPLEARLADIPELLMQAQQMLLRQVKEKKIVIELNPSSNVRITGVDAASEVPTARLFEMVGKGLLACINTDDPGVFTTRIENEYSLVLRAALDLNVKPDDAMKWLKDIQRFGMDKSIVRWPQ